MPFIGLVCFIRALRIAASSCKLRKLSFRRKQDYYWLPEGETGLDHVLMTSRIPR
jgi:hypothetical protein